MHLGVSAGRLWNTTYAAFSLTHLIREHYAMGLRRLAKNFKASVFFFCALWQPVWWHAASDKNGTALYEQMGEYCLGYAPRGDRDVYACFAGIGLAAMRDETYNIEGIRNLCKSASSQQYYQAYCRSEGAIRSLGYAKIISEETLFSVCKDLSAEAYGVCKARIEGAIEYERSL
jgi:hypothetical protein